MFLVRHVTRFYFTQIRSRPRWSVHSRPHLERHAKRPALPSETVVRACGRAQDRHHTAAETPMYAKGAALAVGARQGAGEGGEASVRGCALWNYFPPRRALTAGRHARSGSTVKLPENQDAPPAPSPASSSQYGAGRKAKAQFAGCACTMALVGKVKLLRRFACRVPTHRGRKTARRLTVASPTQRACPESWIRESKIVDPRAASSERCNGPFVGGRRRRASMRLHDHHLSVFDLEP